MKPRSSRATTPSSQSVRGAAPMNTKQASTSSTVSVPSDARMPQRPQVTVLALGTDGLGSGSDLDVVQRGDLLDQVVGHRLHQRVSPHQHRHLAGEPLK